MIVGIYFLFMVIGGFLCAREEEKIKKQGVGVD